MVYMKKQALNHYGHCVYNILFHMVLVTKYRRKCLNAEILERMRDIVDERCRGWRGELVEFNGEKDHVHLLVSLPPTAEPAKFVNGIKTNTSRLLRRDFAEHLDKFYWKKPVLWSASYFITSCGGAPLEVIKKYIQEQDAPA